MGGVETRNQCRSDTRRQAGDVDCRSLPAVDEMAWNSRTVSAQLLNDIETIILRIQISPDGFQNQLFRSLLSQKAFSRRKCWSESDRAVMHRCALATGRALLQAW